VVLPDAPVPPAAVVCVGPADGFRVPAAPSPTSEVVLSAATGEVALDICVEVASGPDEDELVNAAAVKTPSDAEAPLLLDAKDVASDMLGMVEFGGEFSDINKDAGAMLTSSILVGKGGGIKDAKLVAPARAEAPEAKGYAGTVRSLGYGGTAGTTGRATVGSAGTAGTWGKEGIAGTGTAAAATSITADVTGAAAESTALTIAGTTGAAFVGCGESTG
jgi:hypothetical protein